MNIGDFLIAHLGVNEVKNLKAEGVDLTVPYYDGGVLTVLYDLFDWSKSKKGYKYWYAVAHVDYV